MNYIWMNLSTGMLFREIVVVINVIEGWITTSEQSKLLRLLFTLFAAPEGGIWGMREDLHVPI
jgi:hypothetical protein